MRIPIGGTNDRHYADRGAQAMTALDELRAELVTQIRVRFFHRPEYRYARNVIDFQCCKTDRAERRAAMHRVAVQARALDDLTRRHARTVAALQEMAAHEYEVARRAYGAYKIDRKMHDFDCMAESAAACEEAQLQAAALSRLVREALGIEEP